MKTLLSIIVALALLFAFSLPAMASIIQDETVGHNTITDAAIAQEESTAIRVGDLSNMFNDNRTFDNDNNAVAIAELKQVNAINNQDDELIDSSSGKIDLYKSVSNFSGIANVNLNTGAMNNQAIQNTFAVSVAGAGL